MRKTSSLYFDKSLTFFPLEHEMLEYNIVIDSDSSNHRLAILNISYNPYIDHHNQFILEFHYLKWYYLEQGL